MTLEQLKQLRDSYMKEAVRPDGRKSTAGEYMKISLDGGIDLVTTKDLITFDDANEIVHAVCLNEDMRSQATFPVKIISSDYSMIQQVETIMSQKNFENFINDGYLTSLLSSDKKTAMLNWTRSIRNQAQQPLEAEPYFNTNPVIIPMAHSKIKREDCIMSEIFTVTGADGARTEYTNAIEAVSNIKDGDTLVLSEKVYMNYSTSGNTVFDINRPISATIDLGGNSMHINNVATMFKLSNGAKLTVKNGTILTSGEAFRLDGMDSTEETIPELILEDDVTVASTSDCCIFVRGNVKVTSAANLVASGTYAAIQGNGRDTDITSEINIVGGTITANDVGIYQPQNCILNIDGCTINARTALYIKSGRVNINDGSFMGNGDASEYKFNSNGCNATGDAIVVDFCNYPGGDPIVNISGGLFSSVNANAFIAYDKEGNADPEISSANINIIGGSFDNMINEIYIADGYVCEMGANKMYTISNSNI